MRICLCVRVKRRAIHGINELVPCMCCALTDADIPSGHEQPDTVSCRVRKVAVSVQQFVQSGAIEGVPANRYHLQLYIWWCIMHVKCVVSKWQRVDAERADAERGASKQRG